MKVSSILKIEKWISGKLCLETRRIPLFYKIFAEKMIKYQFLSYDI
jgi:hypothetical protein